MHRHLDGVLQVLAADVEAVVVGLAGLQDVPMLGGLAEDRQERVTPVVENSSKQQGGVANIYWLWLLSELKGYWVSEEAGRDLPPGVARVQAQVDHGSIQLDFQIENADFISFPR